MFTREVRIYRSEDDYQGFICEHESQSGSSSIIKGRSPAEEWTLILPDNMQALGITLDLRGVDDPDDWFVGERWYYGNVL
ncbi:DUF3916 domain-containing protein [Yersinia wautersii]|uniref:Uncharacterized protein n=1 Tax=Yersinia pseudotuberculosis TaxID=633 RepID=A0A380Q3D2_YERPU|nr:Uncharacterised protein [Yersinia pseudotuberculosis]